jgi:hypothetical protein
MLTLANALFAAIIVWHSLTVLNAMSRSTAMVPRIGFVLMAGGAFSFLLAPFYKAPAPDLGTVMMTAGVAVWCLYRSYRRKHGAANRVHTH